MFSNLCLAEFCLVNETDHSCGTSLSVPFSKMSFKSVSSLLIQVFSNPSACCCHVDDVLCLCRRNYLDETLMPSSKAKYKVACQTLCKAGDELTFLKRRHVMVTDDEMAIQSHPKHLERLFDLLAINRKLQPKRTPGHPLLDEPDNSKALGPADASVNRSCVGVLLLSSGYCGMSIHHKRSFTVNVFSHDSVDDVPSTPCPISLGMH